MILETVCHLTGMRSRIDLKAVCDSVLIKNVMQLGGIDAQAVLVAYIDRDAVVSVQLINVLVDEREWCVCRPLREDIRL